jgi:hypothetical protein
VVAGVIIRRWITFCGVATCTGMSGSRFGLSSRLRIVLFVFVICWLFVNGVINGFVFDKFICLSGVELELECLCLCLWLCLCLCLCLCLFYDLWT